MKLFNLICNSLMELKRIGIQIVKKIKFNENNRHLDSERIELMKDTNDDSLQLLDRVISLLAFIIIKIK